MTEPTTKENTVSTIKDLQAELSKKIQKEGARNNFKDQMKRTSPFLPKTERFLKTPNQQWVSQNNSQV